MRIMKKSVLVVFMLGALLLVSACQSTAPVPTPTPAPVPAPAPVDPIAAGKQLFIGKGCAACHGQSAEGTNIGPALPGHNEEEVKLQVRLPVGTMPRSGPGQISDDELEMIADYIASLAPAAEHEEPVAMENALVVHHWMALYALIADNEPETEHHVSHILEMVTDPAHKAQMEEVLEQLESGERHEAEHAIEEMLAGTADPGQSLKKLHLQLSQPAFLVSDVEEAKHHIEHFVDLATGDEKARGEEILDLLEQGNIHDAEHEVDELME